MGNYYNGLRTQNYVYAMVVLNLVLFGVGGFSWI